MEGMRKRERERERERERNKKSKQIGNEIARLEDEEKMDRGK